MSRAMPTANGPRKPWRKLLACSLFFLLLPGGGAPSCSHLAVESPVVPLGGTVSATCTLWKRRCAIREDAEVHVAWRWNGQPLAGARHSLGDGVEVSNVTVGPVNQPGNTLSCWLQREGMQQMMNLTQIRAGYPPPEPQNLTCVMNITSASLTCRWDPGEDSLLPVSVALEGVGSGNECGVPLRGSPLCDPSAGQHACSVPRRHLYLFQNMVFWVSAKNDLGSVRSQPLCADPMDLVKLDPPILRVAPALPEEAADCVAVAWEGTRGSDYMNQACELGYRLEGERPWTSVHINSSGSSGQSEHCGFLFATLYQFRLRCRPLLGSYWSDWSPAVTFTTQERDPSGQLDTWWKARPRELGQGKEVLLMWKPMKPSEAHGNILSYRVTLRAPQQSRDQLPLCNTTALRCTFLLPPGGQRVFLVASNSQGASPPTEVSLEEKGQPVPKVWASRADGRSLWVHWERPMAPPANGYVVEWSRVPPADPFKDQDSLRWITVRNGTATQALIQGGLQPFRRYCVAIYPLYRDALGAAQATEAYTLQTAPAQGPKLHPGNISKSTAEVFWRPIPVEKRNGFILNYTLFWIGTHEDMNSAVVDASVHAFTLRDLWPSRMYQVHLMASTENGSTNGSVLTLYTKDADETDTTFLYIVAGLLLVMVVILVLCLQKNKRMKTQFWPSVPDPANSSLGKWAPAVLQEETRAPPAPLKPCELSPVVVSAVLVIEAEEKKCLACGNVDPGKAPKEGDEEEGVPAAFRVSYVQDADATALLKGSPPGGGPYVNSPEPVQYARVAGDSYRTQRPASGAGSYVRSDSTQPLLGEPSPSPKPYENLWFHSDPPGGEAGPAFPEGPVFLERALRDFPLLQGLRIEGGEDLSHFRNM